MALTGEPITAQEALDAGLLSEMTEPGEALDAAIALAERIAENAPLAVKASKTLCGLPPWASRKTSFGRCRYPCKIRFCVKRCQEGPVAFAEKRSPNWTGT